MTLRNAPVFRCSITRPALGLRMELSVGSARTNRDTRSTTSASLQGLIARISRRRRRRVGARRRHLRGSLGLFLLAERPLALLVRHPRLADRAEPAIEHGLGRGRPGGLAL